MMSAAQIFAISTNPHDRNRGNVHFSRKIITQKLLRNRLISRAARFVIVLKMKKFLKCAYSCRFLIDYLYAIAWRLLAIGWLAGDRPNLQSLAIAWLAIAWAIVWEVALCRVSNAFGLSKSLSRSFPSTIIGCVWRPRYGRVCYGLVMLG